MDTKELERSLSMDEILKTIRSVVSEGMEEKKENDILELTEIVEAGNPSILEDQKGTPSKDILEAIDEVVGKDAEKQPIFSENPKIAEIDLTEEVIEEPKVDETKIEPITEKPALYPQEEEKISFSEKNTKDTTIKAEAELKISNNEEILNETLISEEVLEASAKALKALVAEDKTIDKIEEWGSKLTLEDLIVRMLKPELSRWLDKNLPTIIQKIVEKEIKKIMPKAKK
jgi:cell pole-organizing protein PopZ